MYNPLDFARGLLNDINWAFGEWLLIIMLILFFIVCLFSFCSLFLSDYDTTRRDPIIAVAIVVPILALLALLTYWYFRHPRDRSSNKG